ncbi:MAG: prephenate dehydrogenase [Christensenellales bacterium]|jgi:prephenate dehydrogenase
MSAAPGPARWPADYRVTIVGLGLMGGSIARALAPHRPAALWAVDRDPAVLERARQEGVITRGFTDAREPLGRSDLVIVCLYPGDAIRWINENRVHMQKSAVITDICGVKTSLVDGVTPLGDGEPDYVPGHPMAGSERWGYGESSASLFAGCNYILTPLPRNRPESISLVKALARTLGAARVVVTDAATHDEYIAFTSQIPHVLSVAYMHASEGRPVTPFAGGSFGDVSRVAFINERIWTELFIRNRDRLTPEIRKLARRLIELADLIDGEDAPALAASMREARRMKEAYDAADHR